MSLPISKSSPPSVKRAISPNSISNQLKPLLSPNESAQVSPLNLSTNSNSDISSTELNLFGAHEQIEPNTFSSAEINSRPILTTRFSTLILDEFPHNKFVASTQIL